MKLLCKYCWREIQLFDEFKNNWLAVEKNDKGNYDCLKAKKHKPNLPVYIMKRYRKLILKYDKAIENAEDLKEKIEKLEEEMEKIKDEGSD